MKIAEHDLGFLVRCRDIKVIPMFLNSRLANKPLRSSLTHAQFQSILALEKIRQKKSNVIILRKKFGNLRSSQHQQINSIDYAHICSTFLKSYDLKLKSNSVVQQKKFYNLSKEKRSTQDPKKVIFNFSKYLLSGCEKPIFTRFQFQYTYEKLEYSDYVVNFELFFRDIRNLDIFSNEDLDFVNPN